MIRGDDDAFFLMQPIQGGQIQFNYAAGTQYRKIAAKHHPDDPPSQPHSGLLRKQRIQHGAHDGTRDAQYAEVNQAEIQPEVFVDFSEQPEQRSHRSVLDLLWLQFFKNQSETPIATRS